MKHLQIAEKLKTLKATQRETASALGVGQATIHRDLNGNDSNESNKKEDDLSDSSNKDLKSDNDSNESNATNDDSDNNLTDEATVSRIIRTDVCMICLFLIIMKTARDSNPKLASDLDEQEALETSRDSNRALAHDLDGMMAGLIQMICPKMDKTMILKQMFQTKMGKTL